MFRALSFSQMRLARRLVLLLLLFAPVLLIGGLVSGLFGPTEVAGVTVIYAVLIGKLFYRTLTWQGLVSSARETVEAPASIEEAISELR